MPGDLKTKKMVQKTGYQIDPNFNFFKYFDYYMSLKLKGNMKVILLYLIKCHGPNGIINPSQKDMAKKCGMNLTQLKDNLKKLEALGLIRRCRTGRSCYYWIAKPDSPESRLSNRPETRLSDSPENRPSLIRKNKKKDKSKEKMLPQGISFDSFFDNLPEGIAGKIQRKTVKDFWDKGFEDDLIGLSKSLASSPLDERILIFQGTLKIFDRKLQMKNEQIAIDESNAHKLNFVAAPDRLMGLSSVVGQSI